MLTPQQQATLVAYINSIPEWTALPNDSTSALFLSAQLDAAASPDFVVWRSYVTQDEIMTNGFDWVRVDNLSVGKARIWEWMFANDQRAINPSKANVRAGIDETWKGTQADLNVRAAVYVHCKRLATIGEKVLATGDGTTESPAVMSLEGTISWPDIQAARSV